MRILFCNFEYPPLGGGGGVANAWLAEELAKRHEVTVLTSQGLGLARKSLEGGVCVRRVPVFCRRQQTAANVPSMFAYMVQGARFGRRLLQAQRFDVINTHFVLPSGPVGDALARAAGVPNVLTLHGGDLFDPSKWISPHRHAPLRAWVRHLMRRADHLVAQSHNTIANARAYYDPDLPITRIPLGIRRPPEVTGRRSDYGFRASDLLLVTVARLVARKSIDQLVALLPELTQAHLVILGSGIKEPELRAQASALGVAERVHFFGFVSEIEKFRVLRMADLFVSTSQHEGFGLVFLESMAAGLPVVCYDHGGQSDFLENGVTGGVVTLNDRAAFAQALGALAADPERRVRIGVENRRRAEPFYIDHCAHRYESLFGAVAAAHPRNGTHPNPLTRRSLAK